MIASLERLLSAADHQNELANTLLQATLLQSDKLPQPLPINQNDNDYDVCRLRELQVKDTDRNTDTDSDAALRELASPDIHQLPTETKTVMDAVGAAITTTNASDADMARELLRSEEKHHREDLVRQFNTSYSHNTSYSRTCTVDTSLPNSLSLSRSQPNQPPFAHPFSPARLHITTFGHYATRYERKTTS